MAETARLSSLQKIQSLEKDFPAFESQLRQVRDILGFDDANCGVRKRSSYHSREQWALRWLLKKLHSEESSGAS